MNIGIIDGMGIYYQYQWLVLNVKYNSSNLLLEFIYQVWSIRICRTTWKKKLYFGLNNEVL